MLYIQTGQMITTPNDTRSLDEKMMDTQKILSELSPKLLTITDGVYTSQILNQLRENPNLLRFVYNSWPRIEQYMNTNFARGVTALIFMNYINEQVKVTTKEVGQSPFYIFRPKILEYSEKFLNDIINKGNLIKSKKLKTTYNSVLEDLKEKVSLYKELKNIDDKIDNSYMVEGMSDWMSEFEENQKGLIAKWEGIIESSMIYQEAFTEKELEQVLNEYRDLMIVEDDLTVADIRRLIQLMRDTYKKQEANKEKMFNMFDPSKQTNPDDYYSRFLGEPSGKQTTGKGLTVRKQRQPRVKIGGSVLPQPKEPLYTPFGTKIINKPDLNKGILKLRSAKGGALVKIPSQSVSSDLAEVLKQIVAGDIPSDNILDSLMDNDKQLLHKIISESQLTDKVKVPDVNYDKIDREYRRYLLLRGEVLAGNTNYELIKELKRAILKLTHDGRLPKAQSAAALNELAILDL
jgi:hypothetical protein